MKSIYLLSDEDLSEILDSLEVLQNTIKEMAACRRLKFHHDGPDESNTSVLDDFPF